MTANIATIGRPCETCRHPERLEIERAIASGMRSLRGIAGQWSIAPESLRRHAHAHLAEAAREALTQERGLPAADIAARVLAVADAARDARHDAADDGNARLGLMAGKAEIEALSVLSSRLGISSADALRDLDDAHALAAAVMDVVRTSPNAAADIAAALDRHGRTAWAASIRKIRTRTEGVSA